MPDNAKQFCLKLSTDSRHPAQMVTRKKALIRSFISYVMERHTTQIKLSSHNELEKKVSYKCHLFCGRLITRFAHARNMTVQTSPKQISESFHQNKIRNIHSLPYLETYRKQKPLIAAIYTRNFV